MEGCSQVAVRLTMLYELLSTTIIILLGFLVYMQYVKSRKIYLFQDAVDLRLSACYAEEELCPHTQLAIVKVRIELMNLSNRYSSICIDNIGFIQQGDVRFQHFSSFSLCNATDGNRIQEYYILVRPNEAPEMRLNGLELFMDGYLLCPEQRKHSIYQKVIVFERPAILDIQEKVNRA